MKEANESTTASYSESAGAQALMRLFDKYKQSTKQLTQAISTVMDVLEEYGEPNQVSMFGEREAPELASIVSQAQARMDSGRVQYSMREGRYDISKSYEKQLDDLKNGILPKEQPLIIGRTSGILEQVGFAPIPLVYDREHVSETGKSSKLPGTAFMHSLYALVRMDGKIVLMKLYAEQALNQKTGEIFTRAYNVLYIEKVADMAEGVHSENGGLTLKTTATDISIAKAHLRVNM